MSPEINVQTLSVQFVHENAGIFCGSNFQSCWKNTSKLNQGFGIFSGDCNSLPATLNMINDPDNCDTLLAQPDAD